MQDYGGERRAGGEVHVFGSSVLLKLGRNRIRYPYDSISTKFMISEFSRLYDDDEFPRMQKNLREEGRLVVFKISKPANPILTVS